MKVIMLFLISCGCFIVGINSCGRIDRMRWRVLNSPVYNANDFFNQLSRYRDQTWINDHLWYYQHVSGAEAIAKIYFHLFISSTSTSICVPIQQNLRGNANVLTIHKVGDAASGLRIPNVSACLIQKFTPTSGL